MRRQLMMSWQRLCRLIMISRPFGKPLRDKAIAVAGRVTIMEEGMTLKASCPVCLQVLSTPLDSDLKMTLAVHMSLWHADDVQLHWEVMQNKGRSIVHMPSFCFGAGVAAGIGALMVILARSHAQAFGNNRSNIIRLNPSAIACLYLERQALSHQLLRSLPILSPISPHL